MYIPSRTIIRKDKLIYYEYYEVNKIIDKITFSKQTLYELPCKVFIYINVSKIEYDELKNKRLNGKIKNGKYYKTTYYKIYTDEERIEFVNKLLKDNKLVLGNFKNNEDFLLTQTNTFLPQNNNQPLTSTYSRVLDLLSTYICNDNFKELKHTTLENVEKEHNHKRYNKVEENDDCKLSTNVKWQNSKTKKMNDIFSFDNGKDKRVFKYWMCPNEENTIEKYHITRKRLINPYDKYIAEWCIVDTNSVFKFDGNYYTVKNIFQYDKKEVRENMYKLEYDMDKILCFKQYGELYFFDEDINQVSIEKYQDE